MDLPKTNSNILDENLRLRETIKQLRSNSISSMLEEENQVLKQKVNSLDLRLKDLGLILNVKKKNRKVEKRKLIEEKEILVKKVLELENLKNVDTSNFGTFELE